MSVKVQVKEVKGILTKSNLPVSDYSVNPYVGCAFACRYCYASFMKRFTGHQEPWGEFVDVKMWPPIKNPRRYAGKELFIGSVCDPYQPAEREYGRTRALLEQLAGSGAKISIATKGDLVLRDLDLIRSFPDARVSWSINTLDEDFKRQMDHGAAISRRIDAMRAFHEAGVRTTCFISPIFPGITDVPAIIDRCRDACNIVWLENLNLRGGFKKDVLDWVHASHPELDDVYRAIYSKGDRSYWYELDAELHGYCEEAGLPYVRDDDTTYQTRPLDAPPIVVNYFFHEEVKKSAKA